MTQHTVALISDSACDLPDDLLERHAITIVPLYITWGAEQLRDRVDIEPGQFYRRLAADPVHPMTSQPTPADFAAAIARVQAYGAEQVVIITISSGMSSTYDSARQALPQTSIPVRILDSRANSLSQGWQVLAAARAREAARDAGQDVAAITEAMVAAAESVRQRVVTRLYVDTLEYLHRGGRISRARMWIGSALNLKPLLQVNHTNGKIEPRDRARSRKQALEKLYQDFFASLPPGEPLHVGLLHADTPDEAAQWAERIRQEHDPAELLIGVTSPVMGVHTGPGAMALCGYAGA